VVSLGHGHDVSVFGGQTIVHWKISTMVICPRRHAGHVLRDTPVSFLVTVTVILLLLVAASSAARLRHIAGTGWSTKRYLNIGLLKDHQMRGAITA
jgi:hypothetical protein